MNSSGIKRGLAGSAVAALAVTGLPFLASSASAVTGDVLKVVSAGPALNGDGPGAQILVRVTEGSVVNATDLKVIGSDLTSSPNTPTQTVVEGTPSKAVTDSNATDHMDEYIVPVTVTTPNAGDTAKFAIYNDSSNTGSTGKVDAAEARDQASVTTSGPVSSIDLSPATQSTSSGVASGPYTATVKDAGGRVTQLATGDSLNVSADNGATPNPSSLSSSDLALGSAHFTVTGGNAGKTTVTVADSKDSKVKNTATLQVTPAASLSSDNINVVTGADSWSDFGDDDGGQTAVRVDQSSLTLEFQPISTGQNKGATVILTASTKSGHATFGGETTSGPLTTNLDDNGVGSLTITPDAGSIREGDIITVSGDGWSQDFTFEKAHEDSIETMTSPYFAAFGSAVTVDATVLDQFGQPVTTGYVTAGRTGANNDATPQKQAVGADGKVSFTFTDTKAKDALSKQDTVTFNYFVDQYALTPKDTAYATIKYSADGKGKDFNTNVNGSDTEAQNYDPSKNSIVPLADAVDDDYTRNSGWQDETAELDVTGAEPNQAVTVSVDNGALILKSGDDKLSQGVSSISGETDNNGELSGYRVIGTKSGLVTVTVSSANRTETASFTVSPQTDPSTARNVTVSGPAEVEHGTSQITYTAVITDAFGNPIADFPREYVVPLLNIQVSGPAELKDGDARTNQAGQMNLNVAVDPDAVGAVGIRVEGLAPSNYYYYNDVQFGAAADHVYNWSNSKDGEGLPASSNVGTATTNVKGATPPPPASDINLALNGVSNGAKDDVLKADADPIADGLVAKLYKKTANGWKKIASAALNANGNHKFKAVDGNGNKATTYEVRVAATDTTNADTARKRVR